MEAELLHIQSEVVETMEEIGVGLNELVLRFTEGLYKGRFFYVKTDVIFMQIIGERIGSGNPDIHQTTVYIENAGLSDVHCIINFREDSSEYFLINAEDDTSGV